MSDELTLRASLSFTKGGTSKSLSFGPLDFDVAGTRAVANRQAIGFASAEAVLVGDVAAGGYFIGINRDPTNYITLRNGSGGTALVRLSPGDFCMFRIWPSATLFAVADTASCDLEYVVVDA